MATDTIMVRIRKIKDLSFSLIIVGKLGQVLFWFIGPSHSLTFS